jgi:hypothetical protein
MVDVPLVYFAVNFWKTQHPTNSVVPSLKGKMLEAFAVGMIAYHLLYVVLLMVRRDAKRDQRLLEETHDLAAETGALE